MMSARVARSWLPSAHPHLASTPLLRNQQVKMTTADVKAPRPLLRAKQRAPSFSAEGLMGRIGGREASSSRAPSACAGSRVPIAKPCRLRAHLTPAVGGSCRSVSLFANQSQLPNAKRRRAAVRAQASAASVASSGGGNNSSLVEFLVELSPAGSAQPEQLALTAEELELARETIRRRRAAEKVVETWIVNCRFFTLAGVFGSLTGSLLCFLKGSYYVSAAVVGYFMMVFGMPNRCKVVLKLIEALDTYLVGTVMLIFGMGLYELFVTRLDGAVGPESGSTFFGLFPLEKRPAWLAIKGLDDLKTKLGHVIVMILLVGMFEKSKIVQPTCSLDLFLTAGSVLLCAGSLFLVSRLKPESKPGAEPAGLH